MCEVEAANRIIKQGTCEGISCGKCPLNVLLEDSKYNCMTRGDVVTQAKEWLSKRKPVYVH